MIKNMDVLNALASDLLELSASSYKFECALDQNDKKLVFEFLIYYQDILGELQEGIQYLKKDFKVTMPNICTEVIRELRK